MNWKRLKRCLEAGQNDQAPIVGVGHGASSQRDHLMICDEDEALKLNCSALMGNFHVKKDL